MVNEVNNYIKKLMATDILLSFIEIEGEISNFTHHYSGHMYFSLKDEKSRIRCVMFKGDNSSLEFKPGEGAKVIVTGSVSVYERDGSYQVYVRKMEKQGIGDLYRAFNRLKEKLEKEGLFDVESKKEIPELPKKIGVVTSSTGAAIRDILSILKRRYPPVDIVIYPVLVQGDRAPASIIKGLETLDKREDVDLIITGRGGGSMEELFAFNDEKLARCIFSLKTPIISAVGHETDFTIADFVADIRASTPSAAAELAVPDKDALMDELRGIAWALDKHTSRTILEQRNIIDSYKTTLNYINPVQKLMDKKIELDGILKSIEYMVEKKFINKEKNLSNLKNRLQLVDPETILKRGYGVVSDHNGNIRKNISEIILDERLYINMIDGRADVVVLNKEEV